MAEDPWTDFETWRHGIKNNTVEKLKQIVTGFMEETGLHIQKTGRKQDLIDRIVTHMNTWRNTKNTQMWTRAKNVLSQVHRTGIYDSGKGSGSSSSIQLSPYQPSTGYINGHKYNGGVSPTVYRPAQTTYSTTPTSTTLSVRTSNLKFRPSPFLIVNETVSEIAECPESINSQDRKNQSLNFRLTQEQIDKLNSTSPRYQLRLYCTSSAFYTPGGFRQAVCPIEFPATCEIRVNTIQLTANTKGLKKKPGTSPPADLGSAVRTTGGGHNRIDMVYINSQQPYTPKTFYLLVNLCELRTVDELVSDLAKNKYKSREEVFQRFSVKMEQDDDIVAGQQKLTLKCPLSYTRINTPCRASSCVHSQCFDATSWFSMMEQTTTWLCPVCERTLSPNELIVDGYDKFNAVVLGISEQINSFFDSILKSAPESVDDVVLESDGQWHTSDGKYGSTEWLKNHPSPVASKAVSNNPPTEHDKDRGSSSRSNGLPKNASVVILDSDSDEEVSRALEYSFETARRSMANSSSTSLASRPNRPSGSSGVIDLTEDSDDDGPPPPPRTQTQTQAPSQSNPAFTMKRRLPENEVYDRDPKRARPDLPPQRSPLMNGTNHSRGNSQIYPAPIRSFDSPNPWESRGHGGGFNGNTHRPSYGYSQQSNSSSSRSGWR